jgi:hypothetical protein
MKKLSFLLAALSAFFMASCGSSDTTGSKSSENDQTAVCVWDNAPLKDSPEENGKWLCGISIGEAVTYLNDSKEVKTSKKTVQYIKVHLNDAKEGWVQSDFVIVKSKPAAVAEEATIYARPDLLNKSEKVFSKMDIVAVKSEKDDFIEVVGKRKGGKWIETGWIKSNTVTYAAVDIAVSKYANKALAISDKRKREEAVNQILTNSDLKSSIFISLLQKPDTEKTTLTEDTVQTVK